MKKLIIKAFGTSLFVLFLFTGLGNNTYANSDILFGQNHYYSVIFRGNGEAITYAKLVINNPDSKPMTEFSFETPDISITEVAAYQMTLPKACIEYDYSTTRTNPPCLEYEDPDYTSSYYYGYYRSNEKPEYQKIELANTGNTYKFTLPKQIEAYKSSAIIVSYATKGYTEESLGLYKFNFETLKVSSRVQELRVAIETDSDLYLKNKDAEVNYSTSNSSLSAVDSATISSKALDEVVGNIGSYGQINKVARSLSPNESFSVKGEYAENWFRLYFKEILITFLVIAAIFIGTYFLSRYIKKKKGKENKLEEIAEKHNVSSKVTPKEDASLYLTILAGFISVVTTILLTIFIDWLSSTDFIYSLLGYNYYSNPISTVLNLICVLICLLAYSFIILGPAVYFAIKNGWKTAVRNLVAEFLWLLFVVLISLIVFHSGLNNIFNDGGIVPTSAIENTLQ